MHNFFTNNVKKQYLLLFLTAVYLVNGILYIPQQSITGDEGDHMNYAVRFLKNHPEKVRPFDDASTMPFSVLNTIPRAIQQKFNPALVKNDGGVSDIIAGRYITLFVSLLIGIFIYKWATELYGDKAGVAAFFLFVFCPNLNAHAGLVTTDAYSALFTLTTAYYFWKYLTTRSWSSLILFSISLGLAQLAKQSLTHLYLVFLLLALIIYLQEHALFKNSKLKIVKFVLVIGINISVLNIGFLLNGSGSPLKEYHFRSVFFNKVQTYFQPLASTPLPLPKPYLEGLDLTKNIDEMGGGHPESSGRIYILGKSKKGSGFWYYYIVALFFKTPLTVIIGIVVLCLTLLKHRSLNFIRNEFVPLFIILYMLAYFSFFYNSQVGIRHVLFIFPLLYVLISPVISSLLTRNNFFVFLLFICYTAGTFYYYFPNLISYTNELVIPKRNAYKIIADSNLDYRQGYLWMNEYLATHKDVHLPDTIPRPGKYILPVQDYLNLSNTNKHNWLRNFEPAGQYRHCNLIFDISENDLKK